MQQLKQAFLDGSDATITLDAAMGYCVIEKEGIPFEEAYQLADAAMYEDKKKAHGK